MTQGVRRLSNCCLVGLAVLVMLSFANNLAVAGMNRPLEVPEGYVITPFGYFHPSCVRMLAEGETLLADGRVEHPDGTVETTASVCNYPHYTPTGSLAADTVDASGGTPLVINGWLEFISATTTKSYGKITAAWAVPPEPTGNDGQTLFFFPGFEDYDHVISIVQPVLQYGPSSAGGGNYWAVASWNCCMNGTSWYSPLLNVSSGDTIVGTIAPTCKPGKNYCPTWNVVSEDKTTGKKTTLAKTPADGQVWNWAFGAVSEDYGVQTCSDFPPNSGITFTVHLYGRNRKLIANPGWTGTSAPPDTDPKCNYGVKATKTKETVKY